MQSQVDVIAGCPICRRTSYVLDKFLLNQQEIQRAYTGCMLVIATDEPEFVAELREQVCRYDIKAEVITYETTKFNYLRSNIWNVTCGREALRRYVISTKAKYFLSIVAYMIYNPSVIGVMKKECIGFDGVSGNPLKPSGEGGGGGAVLDAGDSAGAPP